MKKILLLVSIFMLLLTGAQLSAQAPNLLNWQSIVRGANNQPVAQGTSVTLEFTLLKGSATGTAVYCETVAKTAGEGGLVTHLIGSGQPLSCGAWANIAWGTASHYLKIRLKIGAGAYADMGTQQLASVPYALWAQSAGGTDSGARWVGSYHLMGDADGTKAISTGGWQQVTRLTYDDMEGHFSTVFPITPGTVREYYLAIQAADNMSCNVPGSLWRFYFGWDNVKKPGHAFIRQRDNGSLAQGEVRFIQIPSIEKQKQAAGAGNHYYRLEAKIPDACPGSSMRVYSIDVVAIDKPNGTLHPVTLDNTPTEGVVVPSLIGPHDKITVEPNGNVTLRGTLDCRGTIIADVSNNSGIDGRDALFLWSSPDNNASVILSNKSNITFWNASEDHSADLSARNGSFHNMDLTGPLTVDLTQWSGNDGRNAIFLKSSNDNNTSIIVSNKNEIGLWSTSLNSYANFRARNGKVNILEITGGDVAEARHSTTGEQLPAGSVVVFDEKEKGKIRLTSTPYDKKVAGVISGAGNYFAGVCLQQEELEKGAMPVAQIGTVEVLAIGPIEVGDLLTTSKIPGYAMKATNRRMRDGAVIGKATASLRKGEKGLVEIQIEKH